MSGVIERVRGKLQKSIYLYVNVNKYVMRSCLRGGRGGRKTSQATFATICFNLFPSSSRITFLYRELCAPPLCRRVGIEDARTRTRCNFK